MKVKAVIDFDTPIFTACLAGQGDVFEHSEDFDIDVDYKLIKERIESAVEDILFETGATYFSLHITGSGNFRYALLPSYKWRRKDSARPVALEWAKQWVKDKYGDSVVWKDGCEADDTATQDYTNEEEGVEKILCHIDKDLDQYAGKHYDFTSFEEYVVTPEEAHYNLWKQVLQGDTADCYKGCPKVGKDKAHTILTTHLTTKPYLHTFKRGKKKGMTEVRWEEYHDSSKTLLERIFDWYVKGYYLMGGQGHVKGFNTTSGFEDNVKIDIDWELNQYYISPSDRKFLEREIEIQYTVARMLKHGEEIPTKPNKLF